MNARTRQSAAESCDARSRADSQGRDAGVLWSVTFLLLSLVAAIYAFGGTSGEPAGLYGYAATVVFLVLAALTFVSRRPPKSRK